MLKGVDLNQRIEFSSKQDKEPKTIFVLKPLSGVEMLDLMRNIEGEELRLSKQYVLQVIGGAVVEIKNPDITDKQAIIDYVISLEPTVLIELVTEAGNINKFSEEEEKN